MKKGIVLLCLSGSLLTSYFLMSESPTMSEQVKLNSGISKEGSDLGNKLKHFKQKSPTKKVDLKVVTKKIKQKTDLEKLKAELKNVEDRLEQISYVHVANNEATSNEDRQEIQKLLIQRETVRRQIILAELNQI